MYHSESLGALYMLGCILLSFVAPAVARSHVAVFSKGPPSRNTVSPMGTDYRSGAYRIWEATLYGEHGDLLSASSLFSEVHKSALLERLINPSKRDASLAFRPRRLLGTITKYGVLAVICVAVGQATNHAFRRPLWRYAAGVDEALKPC